MKKKNIKKEKRLRRRIRIRARIKGTNARPRLSVFRSGSHVWLQLIDDVSGKTIVSASDRDVRPKGKKPKTGAGMDAAFGAGKLVAERAKEKKISRAVFDRGGYRYHGIVQKVAEGAREGGLQF